MADLGALRQVAQRPLAAVAGLAGRSICGHSPQVIYQQLLRLPYRLAGLGRLRKRLRRQTGAPERQAQRPLLGRLWFRAVVAVVVLAVRQLLQQAQPLLVGCSPELQVERGRSARRGQEQRAQAGRQTARQAVAAVEG